MRKRPAPEYYTPAKIRDRVREIAEICSGIAQRSRSDSIRVEILFDSLVSFRAILEWPAWRTELLVRQLAPFCANDGIPVRLTLAFLLRAWPFLIAPSPRLVSKRRNLRLFACHILALSSLFQIAYLDRLRPANQVFL